MNQQGGAQYSSIFFVSNMNLIRLSILIFLNMILHLALSHCFDPHKMYQNREMKPRYPKSVDRYVVNSNHHNMIKIPNIRSSTGKYI